MPCCFVVLCNVVLYSKGLLYEDGRKTFYDDEGTVVMMAGKERGDNGEGVGVMMGL